MPKLAPIQTRMLTLTETRNSSDFSWGHYGVGERQKAEECWAEIRVRGSSNYAPLFEGCKIRARPGFLTCHLHHDRELAARELRCEKEGVQMADIAYANEAERKAALKASAEALRQALTRKSTQ